MSWTESSKGRFERPLSTVETLYKTLANLGTPINREHWAVRLYARFQSNHSVEDAETSIRHAWKTMRHDHPQIASYAEGNLRVYQTPDSGALESWLKETFIVDPIATPEDLLANVRPTPLPCLYYLPRDSEIFIQIPHWYIDGPGSFCLLNNLFEAIAAPRQIDFGDETKNLSPGLEEALGLPMSSIAEHQQAATEMIMKHVGSLPSIGLPPDLPSQIPGATHRLELKLSPKLTKALVTACRARDITVTVATHAALVAATHRLAADEAQERNYTSFGAIGLRPYLNQEYTDAKTHPINIYLYGLPVSFKPTSFSADSTHLSHFYKQLSQPPSRAEKLPLLPSFTHICATMAAQPPPPEMPQATEPVLSSNGVVDKYLKREYGNGDGGVVLERFWLASEVITKQPVVYVLTWREELSLSVCYNEAFYARGKMDELLRLTREVLVGELGVMEDS